VPTLPCLGNGFRLDKQEAVGADQLGLLAGAGLVGAAWSGRWSFVFILFVVVTGGNPVTQDGLEIGLDIVGVGLFVVLVSAAVHRAGALLVRILVVLVIPGSIGVISVIGVISDIGVIVAGAFVQFLVSVGLQVLDCFFVAHCFLGSATVFAAGS
tara:strand:+ start:358 stop:822 length:465 start_codon:yes stop_codon:yes gene_type:complete